MLLNWSPNWFTGLLMYRSVGLLICWCYCWSRSTYLGVCNVKVPHQGRPCQQPPKLNPTFYHCKFLFCRVESFLGITFFTGREPLNFYHTLQIKNCEYQRSKACLAGLVRLGWSYWLQTEEHVPENPFPLFDVKMLKYKTNLLHCRCLRELPANPYLTVNVEINGRALFTPYHLPVVWQIWT